MEPFFIHCEIHHGQLIGIEETKNGYRFHLFSYGGTSCSPEQRTHYSTLKDAVAASTLEAQRIFEFDSGSQACEQGRAIPITATPEFIAGWQVYFNDNYSRRLDS